MTSINLLPWRQYLQKEQQKEFLLLIAMVVSITLFFCLIVHWYFSHKLANQLTVNAYLTQQIATVDQQIITVNTIKKRKNDLIHRLFVIQQLQSDRIRVVKMLYDFINVLPPGIYITECKKKGHDIIVTGRAQSNQQISQFMENINASPSFQNAVLTEIKDDDDPNLNPTNVVNQIYSLSFELHMQQQEMKTEPNTVSSTIQGATS
jgi:type IV pilus assembly protein PilN